MKFFHNLSDLLFYFSPRRLPHLPFLLKLSIFEYFPLFWRK